MTLSPSILKGKALDNTFQNDLYLGSLGLP